MTECWRWMVAFHSILVRTLGCTTYLLHCLWLSDFWTGIKIFQHVYRVVKCKPTVVIGNLDTSSLFVSFTHTWILSLRESMKARIALCVMEINLHGTIRGRKLMDLNMGSLILSSCKLWFFSILIKIHLRLNSFPLGWILRPIRDPKLTSIFLHFCI